MHPLTGDEIRRSFINVSRSQLKSMTLPALDQLDWDSHDFLGWRDPKAPSRGYLVVPREDSVVGVQLRAANSSGPRRGTGLCNLCHSGQPADAVVLFAARRGGAAGRQNNSIGTYICADLSCSLYIRGLIPLDLPQSETLGTEQRVDRLMRRVTAFVDRVA